MPRSAGCFVVIRRNSGLCNVPANWFCPPSEQLNQSLPSSSKPRSVWVAQSGAATQAQAADASSVNAEPLEADVCIIGAGIAGLTTAYQLAYAGQKVIVLEAGRGVAEGESSRTTAQLATEIDDRYFEIDCGTSISRAPMSMG